MSAVSFYERGLEEMARFQFPAWELQRIFEAKPEINWRLRFENSGGRCINERMIALKADDVWKQLLPTFDEARNSGMDWRPVPREQCIAMGLLPANPEVHGTIIIDGEKFNADALRESAKNLRIRVTIEK